MELSQFDQGTTAIDSLIGGKETPQVKLPIRSLQKFETEAKKAIGELAELSQTHDVTVFCENAGRAQWFGELLEQAEAGLAGRCAIAVGYLHRGFMWEFGEGEEVGSGEWGVGGEGRKVGSGELGVGSKEGAARVVFFCPLAAPHSPLSTFPRPALLGHHELFHRYEQRRRVKKIISGRPVDSFLDLKDGDYVVHVAHGIAQVHGDEDDQ